VCEIYKASAKCPVCGGMVEYTRISFMAECGGPDWRLDVWCENCGEVRDSGVLDAIHEDYRLVVGQRINEMQCHALDMRLGPAEHDTIINWLDRENVCGDLPEAA